MTMNFGYLNNTYLICNIPTFLEILFSVHLKWSLHKTFLSNNTPRNLD